MVGIQETKDVLLFGMALGNAIYASVADDGHVTLGDAANFVPAISAMPDALKNISEVPKELKDLDENELAEIRELVLSKIPDIGDKWLIVARESINIGISGMRIYGAFASVGK